MPQKYVDQSGANTNPRWVFMRDAIVHLSDGTVVWLENNGAASPTSASLCWSSDHATVNTLATLTVGSSPGYVLSSATVVESTVLGLTVDSSDNIYVVGTDNATGHIRAQCWTKGSGHTWTAQTAVVSSSAGGIGNVASNSSAVVWCNTGGGTGSAGHILVASGTNGYQIMDAGVLTAGSGTLFVNGSTSPTTFANNAASCLWIQLSRNDSAGFGTPSGICLTTQGTSIVVGAWSVTSGGALGTNTSIATTLTGRTNDAASALNYASGAWAICFTPATSQLAVATYSMTARLLAPVATSAVAGFPYANIGNARSWAFLLDPGIANQGWVIIGNTPAAGSQQIVRLSVALTGTVTWATSITADDVLTNVTANEFSLRSVIQPRVTTVDWQAFVETAATPTFALDGDSTVFDTPPTITGIAATQAIFPLVSWTYNNASGYACQKFRVKIFTTTQAGIGGFDPDASPNTWDSGDVFSTATSITSATAIFAGTYDIYVKAADVVGGFYGPWNFLPFTQLTTELPATPVIVTATNDDTNAAIRLFIQGRDNMLTANQSNLELGTTAGWTAGANTTATNSTTVALDGTHSLRLAATGAGAVIASTPTGLSGVPVSPSVQITALASFRASATGDTATVEILWYKASGAASSVRTSDTSTGGTVTTGTWTQASVTVTSPSDAAFYAVVLNGTGLGAGGFLYADQISVAPGTSTTWTVGGYVIGPQSLVPQRSIDNGVTWVTLSRLWRQTEAGFNYYLAGVPTARAMVGNEAVYGNAAPITAGVPDIGQTWQIIDYEAPRASTTVVYRAQVMSFDGGGNPIVSAQSANVTAPQINIVRTAFKAVNNPTLNKTLYTKKPGIKATPTEPQIIQPVLGAPDVSVIYDTIYGDSLDFTVICLTQAEHDAYRALFSQQDTVLIQDFLGRQWYTHLGPTPAVAPGQGALQGSAYYEIAHGAQQVAVPA